MTVGTGVCTFLVFTDSRALKEQSLLAPFWAMLDKPGPHPLESKVNSQFSTHGVSEAKTGLVNGSYRALNLAVPGFRLMGSHCPIFKLT